VLEVREIDESVNRLRGKDTEGVAIFHGRDLFGYTAARLASGIIDYEGVGPAYPVSEIVRHELLEPKASQGNAEGIFEIDDPNFGNLWTNIPTRLFFESGFAYGDKVRVRVTHENKVVFDQNVLFHQSFGYATSGEPIIYNNEMMKVALAVSCGSFEQKFGLGFGADWRVHFSKA
jgi:S-adenosylmethionine hydrolase